MAFTVNMPGVPTYAGGQLGSAVSGNTLEDVANMAQINTSQQALKKAKATFGSDVQSAKAQAERATTEAASAQNRFGIEQANTMYQILAPYGSDKRIIDAESLTPESTPDQINKTRDNLFDASDAIARQLEAQGMSKGDIRKYTHELNDQILKDPRQVPNLIKRVTQTLAGVSNIAQQNQPQLATVNGQTTTIVPSRGVVPLQGTQPVNAPSMTTDSAGVSQGQMNMPQMQYPVRKAGEAYAQLPNEPKDLEDGRAFRGNLIAAQLELPKMRRNVEEVIKEANALEKSAINQGAGFAGKIERELSTFLGTEEGIRYKQLSKDLANAQLTAIQASGGSLNTDAGKQLAAMANGDVTYPPKVLQQIARRTQADMSNLDMQATAAQKFTQLYGDQNINTFKQMWSSNADSKVFELKNIYDNPKLSAKEKDAARVELLGNDKKTLEDFARKWKNIQKLEKTGTL